IRTLLLTFFYRYLPQIIENKYLYVAQPPLYRININKESKYFYSDEEKDDFLKTIINKKEPISAKKIAKGFVVQKIGTEDKAESSVNIKEAEAGVNIQRYKGLGEMNPDELFLTTMDAGSRILKQVTMDDTTAADEIFDILMGKEVEPRKKFIQTHAKTVQNLDI
ncbi:MAG: DNA topoisomerase IV subunit B, partial [Candidatus Parcubacteria bacterium]|nr:DNA topoisomerase IV subunit B [Candidatus Parcubacteria bacterium]